MRIPSYALLMTTISVVSVSTMLFFLTKKKYITSHFRLQRISSAAIIGGKNDLLTEILVLLPAKTVARFKSVSKQWSSLISSESFTRLHVQNHGRRKRLESQHSFIMGDVHGRPELFICHHTKNKLVRVSIPSPVIKKLCKYNILQSWNGLLLISIEFLDRVRIDYVVFNPTTEQYRLLQLDGYCPLIICLICDPSKPEYYKVLMLTSITPYIYSVYDLATQEWSHNMGSGSAGNPFTNEAALGFRISTALYLNLVVSSIKQGQYHLRTQELMQFPEESVYDNYMFESNECFNLVQLKPFPEENKLSFRVGGWTGYGWLIRLTDTLDFNFKNSSTGVRLLGMMREEGATIENAVFLFHVPGQLLIYKNNSGDKGLKVLVDYRSDYFYVKDEWQFEHVHPFVHTFAYV